MIRKLTTKISPASCLAMLALFVALSSGAYAATQLPKNSVGPKQIKPGAVSAVKIKKHAVTGPKIKPGSIPAAALAAGVIPPPSYTQGESDARYLRGTVTVVGSIAAVEPDSFKTGSVDCPAGYQAIGGGVDPSNVYYGKVAASGPTYDGKRALTLTPGEHGPATGWFGSVSTEGAAVGAGGESRVVVICSPIG